MNDLSLDHERHDPLLIAGHAAGDLTSSDADRAGALVHACPQCAALTADLRALATALHELPRPTRTRDFTITPHDAARLRRGGWRRVREILRGDSFRLARPVGAAFASLGFAGLVLASMTGGVAPGSGSAAAPTSAPGLYEQAAAPEDLSTTAGDGGARAGGEASPATLDAQQGTGPDRDAVTDPDAGADSGVDAAAGTPAAANPNEAIVVLSGSLFIVGVGLFGLRWTAETSD
jgi:anti-sigma factor RsiW